MSLALNDTEKIILSVLISAAVVMVGYFLSNLFLTPPILARKKAPESKPKRTPEQEWKYAQAKVALEEIDLGTVDVLRHLEIHGTMTFDGIDPPLPRGFNARDAKAILRLCAARDLVTFKTISRPSGGVAPIIETAYQIAPGMKAALDELLATIRPKSA